MILDFHGDQSLKRDALSVCPLSLLVPVLEKAKEVKKLKLRRRLSEGNRESDRLLA
jgi:hypothetical protein